MTQEPRSWLPPNATAPRGAIAAIADVIEAWSIEWFPDIQMLTANAFVRVADSRSELHSLTWHVGEGGLAIGFVHVGIQTLGALVLAVQSGSVERTEADNELLVRVGQECFDALKMRLSDLFGLGRNALWSSVEGRSRTGPVHRLVVSAPDCGKVLVLELNEELFARFSKQSLPPPAVPGKLGVPDAALAKLPVRLSAALGKCSISVAELSTLAAGDVLMLDHSLDAPVALAIDHLPAARGACRVARTETGLALELTQAPIG